MQSIEFFLEHSPGWLKSFYITMMSCLKQLLKLTGLLPLLDKQAKHHRTLHYIRSLFAIYQLEDMIKLDVPWWTYSAIDAIEQYIQQLDHPPVAFEYGSGASTIWLAKRCDKVISIEHHAHWYRALLKPSSQFKNIQLLLKEPELSGEEKYRSTKTSLFFKSYVNSISVLSQHYDIIIIDGRSRNACLETALPYLKPNGMIIFDNSNRKRYQALLQDPTIEVIRFYGWVPGSPFKSETAIIKKK